MKKWLRGLFALSFTGLLAGIACAGIANKGDPPGASFRQALLIANADYVDDEVALRHPITDARALADELRRGGFESWWERTSANRRCKPPLPISPAGSSQAQPH